MSRTIHFDGPSDAEYVVSDAEYAGIDWGSTNEDVVTFTTESGEVIFVRLSRVGSASSPGSPPAPGTQSGYRVRVQGNAGSVDVHISEEVKNTLVAALQGPGSDNRILEFTTLEGIDYKVPNANSSYIEFQVESLVTPTP